MSSNIAQPASAEEDRLAFFKQLANVNTNLEEQLSRLMRDPHPAAVGGAWQVFCNNCDQPMADAHFHCSICDNGDYDLCQNCVNSGAGCQGEEHWLIKRFIQDGKVVNSTTETIAPRSSRFNESPRRQEASKVAVTESTPSHSEVRKIDVASLLNKVNLATRTCNACVHVLPEDHFVTCNDCPDIDYCIPCLKSDEHGHNPAHSFKPAVQGAIKTLSPEIQELSKPNRGVRHAAICDICDETICGVRHKCLTCPDFDCCSKCYKSEAQTYKHAHRFVPIYEPLALPVTNETRHFGIYCDGPACNASAHQSYIKGIRYKCAICPDFDLCGNCEAHPANKHNETHPLIKFKTAVRGVSVTTYDDKPAAQTATLGDALPIRTAPSMTSNFRAQEADAAFARGFYNASALSQQYPPPSYSSFNIPRHVSPPYQPRTRQTSSSSSTPATPKVVKTEELAATFIKDAVPDGTAFTPNWKFIQTWTLRNPGPHAWPAGVSVQYVGGENMLNIDRVGMTTVADLRSAQTSNVTTSVVKPGEEHVFHVSMRSPSNEGQHISYWRMKGLDGVPFGHKLWCHIIVKDDDSTVQDGDQSLKNAQEHAAKVEKLNVPCAAREELTKLAANELNDKLDVHIRKIEEITRLHAAAKAKQATVEDEEPATDSKTEATIKDSQVIMPTLERDGTPSASNSMHQDVEAAAETKADSVKAKEEELDELDDVAFESADAGDELDDEEDDDGFLTDEEYDVLDASDEEFRGL